MIDAHAHLISKPIMEEVFKYWGVENARVPGFIDDMDTFTTGELKTAWEEVLEKNGIKKVIFMGMSPVNREFTKFLNSSEKFEGFTSVIPTKDKDALEKVKRDTHDGYIGIKLYPTGRGFSVADERIYDIYEYCQKENIPIMIHFGITIGPFSDLRYGNPVDLTPVLSDFPDIPFIIAHFGAGYLREAMMIAYKRDNIYFDTSGTNNWLEYQPSDFTLKDVFRKIIKLVGPERIIFGTDSRVLVDDYRAGILKKQKEILQELLPKKDVELVMGENARKLYGL